MLPLSLYPVLQILLLLQGRVGESVESLLLTLRLAGSNARILIELLTISAREIVWKKHVKMVKLWSKYITIFLEIVELRLSLEAVF